MTVRIFWVGSLLAGITGGAIWYLTVTSLDPESGGSLSVVLFFLSMFVTITSATSVIGFVLRRLIMPQQFATYTARTSLRQGVMLSLFFALLLWLQLLRLYVWWIALIAIAILASIELIFLSYDRTIKRGTNTH